MAKQHNLITYKFLIYVTIILLSAGAIFGTLKLRLDNLEEKANGIAENAKLINNNTFVNEGLKIKITSMQQDIDDLQRSIRMMQKTNSQSVSQKKE